MVLIIVLKKKKIQVKIIIVTQSMKKEEIIIIIIACQTYYIIKTFDFTHKGKIKICSNSKRILSVYYQKVIMSCWFFNKIQQIYNDLNK